MLKNNGFHNRHSPFARQTAFSPLSLFSGGAPGAWYDPSDLTTLFQDSAGTTPVTAVEQPVGLMLDKSQGLVLGSELFSSWQSVTYPFETFVVSGNTIISAINTAGGFGIASVTLSTVIGKWYFISGALTLNSGTAPNLCVGSGNDLGTILKTTVTGNFSGYFVATTTSMRVGLRIDSAATNFSSAGFSIKELPGNHAFQATSASRPVLSARVNKLLATATLATQSVTTRATAHTLRFEGAGSVTLTGTAIGVYTAGTHSITTTAGTLTLTVIGSVTSADLRETNDGVGVPAYQAVVTSTNYNTTGFLPYVRFDGIDDSLSTNSISFTATDKMSVFAGVRKLSDAFGLIGELSTQTDINNGSFAIYPTTGNKWGYYTRGTSGSFVEPSGYTPPITSVLTGTSNISGDLTTLRVNGAQIAQSTADLGTGNYGNYPLYIGRRTSPTFPFPFNGQLYSLIIVGKAVTAGELSSTETYVNQKTGAY